MPQTISKLHTALLEWMHYDPDTGIWTFLKTRGSRKAGAIAGRLHHSGYRDFQFMGLRTTEHRWAVFYMTGEWPIDQVDHKRVGKEFRSDNRWSEIRPATQSQNFANRKVQKDSLSGVKGVRRLPSGRWFAKLGTTTIGTFDTLKLAGRAVEIAAYLRYGEFACP